MVKSVWGNVFKHISPEIAADQREWALQKVDVKVEWRDPIDVDGDFDPVATSSSSSSSSTNEDPTEEDISDLRPSIHIRKLDYFDGVSDSEDQI